MQNLLSEIEKFMVDHDLSATAFGELALNDRHFVRQLRQGREARFATVRRVEAFMQNFSSRKAA